MQTCTAKTGPCEWWIGPFILNIYIIIYSNIIINYKLSCQYTHTKQSQTNLYIKKVTFSMVLYQQMSLIKHVPKTLSFSWCRAWESQRSSYIALAYWPHNVSLRYNRINNISPKAVKGLSPVLVILFTGKSWLTSRNLRTGPSAHQKQKYIIYF